MQGPLTSRDLKRAILTTLCAGDAPGSARRRQAHKTNLIGREFQEGELELTLKTSFDSATRALAARAFEELKKDDYIRSTFRDTVDPENWVEVTDAGEELVRLGLPEEAESMTTAKALAKPSASVLQVTLDTNCVINLMDTTAQTPTSVAELIELMRLGLSHVVDIAVTTRTEDDLLKDKDPKRRDDMLRMLGMFPIIGTTARWGVSRWGNGDVYGSDDSVKLSQEIQRVVFPGLSETDKRRGNKLNDVDHLVGHRTQGRNIFVTDDGEILKKAGALHAQFGIVVQTPKACLAHIHALEAARVAPLPRSRSDSHYHSSQPTGEVTFDYSNNDGRYTIGTGTWLFETAWSKADAESIYAYHDPPSIECLALAKGAKTISDVGDATILDYSSRTRCPQLGQIVVWRNTKGIYAATRVISIKDDTRGSSHDELRFEYRILFDGSTSF